MRIRDTRAFQATTEAIKEDQILAVDPDIESIAVGCGGALLAAGVGRDVVFWDLRNSKQVPDAVF